MATENHASVLLTCGFLCLNVMFAVSWGLQVTSSSEPPSTEESSWSETTKTAGIVGAVLTVLGLVGVLVALVIIARHQRSKADKPGELPAKPLSFPKYRPQFQAQPASAGDSYKVPTSFMPPQAAQPRGPSAPLDSAAPTGPRPMATSVASGNTFEFQSSSETVQLLPEARKKAEDVSASHQDSGTSRSEGTQFSTAQPATVSARQQYFANPSFDDASSDLSATYASVKLSSHQQDHYTKLASRQQDHYTKLANNTGGIYVELSSAGHDGSFTEKL